KNRSRPSRYVYVRCIILNQSSKNIDKYDVFGRFTFYKVAKSGILQLASLFSFIFSNPSGFLSKMVTFRLTSAIISMVQKTHERNVEK
ncbi:hypothetical protein, partial [Sellimonas catena]|uniref:hypothetical protein n=1 Tax=Sellimonas catena TaxID=2994035 RepID=UPI002492B6CB